MERKIYAAIGVLIMLIAGMVYAWSIVSVPIAADFPEWTKTELSFTFTLVMFMFCGGNMFGGLMSKHFPAAIALKISAVAIFIGYLFASGTKQLPQLYLGYGLLCGFASGYAYNTVMYTVGKYYPDRPGFISGLLLMGNGLSAFFIGKMFQAFTPAMTGGWRISFRVIGIISGILLLVCSFILKQPAADYMTYTVNIQGKKTDQRKQSKDHSSTIISDIDLGKAPDIPSRDMIRMPEFWLYYFWSILLSSAGLALSSQASGMVSEAAPATAAGAVATAAGLISVFNGISRIFMGSLFDKHGRETVMQVVNIVFLASAVILLIALKTGSYYLVALGFVVGGIAYGGVTPSNSAFISTRFGMKHYGSNFAIVGTVLLFASFSSSVSGMLYDLSGSYRSTFIMISALGCVGILLSLGIRYCERKRN